MGKIAFYIGSDSKMGFMFIRNVLRKYPDKVAFIETEGNYCALPHFTKDLSRSNTELIQHTTEDCTIKRIKEYGVTTVVLIWWPKIVKKINQISGLNVINTHPAYLPYNRGKHPYYWALMDGTPFGATIHRVDNGVDTGRILWRKKVQLASTDLGIDAYCKGREATSELLNDHMDNIVFENFPPGIKQDETNATSHHSSEFELPPIKESEMHDGHTLIRDCRARTFPNNYSGRRIEIDGRTYRIHLNLVEENE